jgi:hypothetical protein
MLNPKIKGRWCIAAVGNENEQINRITTSVLVEIFKILLLDRFVSWTVSYLCDTVGLLTVIITV